MPASVLSLLLRSSLIITRPPEVLESTHSHLWIIIIMDHITIIITIIITYWPGNENRTLYNALFIPDMHYYEDLSKCCHLIGIIVKLWFRSQTLFTYTKKMPANRILDFSDSPIFSILEFSHFFLYICTYEQM